MPASKYYFSYKSFTFNDTKLRPSCNEIIYYFAIDCTRTTLIFDRVKVKEKEEFIMRFNLQQMVVKKKRFLPFFGNSYTASSGYTMHMHDWNIPYG